MDQEPSQPPNLPCTGSGCLVLTFCVLRALPLDAETPAMSRLTDDREGRGHTSDPHVPLGSEPPLPSLTPV
jgi:hypothetical protein